MKSSLTLSISRKSWTTYEAVVQSSVLRTAVNLRQEGIVETCSFTSGPTHESTPYVNCFTLAVRESEQGALLHLISNIYVDEYVAA